MDYGLNTKEEEDRIRYGHMGALKVIRVLEENVYIKNINRKVQQII